MVIKARRSSFDAAAAVIGGGGGVCVSGLWNHCVYVAGQIGVSQRGARCHRRDPTAGPRSAAPRHHVGWSVGSKVKPLRNTCTQCAEMASLGFLVD